MADKNVNINVTTKATGTGVKQTTTELKTLEQVQERMSVAQIKLDRLQRVHDRTQRRFGEGSVAVAKSQRNMGMAALEASRAFEDMQYGIRGALNNIPGLIQMLGGTAGLAGVISVVAVGLTIASQHFDIFGQKVKENNEKAKLDVEAFTTALKKNSDEVKKELEKQASAWDDLNDSIETNIDTLERRSDIQGEIDDSQLKIDLAKIEQQEINGELNKEEVIATKALAREKAQQRKDMREETLDYERIKAAAEQAQAAKDELETTRLREQEASGVLATAKDAPRGPFSKEGVEARNKLIEQRQKELEAAQEATKLAEEENAQRQRNLRGLQEKKSANDLIRQNEQEARLIGVGTEFTGAKNERIRAEQEAKRSAEEKARREADRARNQIGSAAGSEAGQLLTEVADLNLPSDLIQRVKNTIQDLKIGGSSEAELDRLAALVEQIAQQQKSGKISIETRIKSIENILSNNRNKN